MSRNEEKRIPPTEENATVRTITIDAEQVQKTYIDGKQPIEVIMSSLEEYALLANMQMLSLLRTVQTWIQEKNDDNCPVIVLPDSESE